MFDKEINISGWLKEWLGEHPTIGDIWLIFGGATIASTLLTIGNYSELAEFPLWRSILFVVVAFDIIGGAIANFTVSTDRYYNQNAGKRWLFLAEHIVHFTLFYIAVGYLWFWIAIFGYTMLSAVLVDSIQKRKAQEVVAPAFVTIGCLLFYGFDFGSSLLAWFPAVFMIKIILGFAVRRFNG